MFQSNTLCNNLKMAQHVYVFSESPRTLATTSKDNCHQFFCETCDASIMLWGGILSCPTEDAPLSSHPMCYNCRQLHISRDLAERFYLGECYAETEEGYQAARAWYLGELGAPPESEVAYELGKKLLLWEGVSECIACGCTAEFRDGERVCGCDTCQQKGCLYNEHHCSDEHHCSGEFDYDRGCYICDDHDDPRCPQSRRNDAACEDCGNEMSVALAAAPTVCPPCAFNRQFPCEGRRNSVVSPRVEKKCCADCGAERKEAEPVLHCDWYCQPCWRVRFVPGARACADCNHVPEDGHFPCYRGDDALCADCEEENYGNSPQDWRERTGRCTKCDLFFDLICSSDDRTCCRSCAMQPPVELDEECPGCGGPSRPGANGYCAACWNQRYGCDYE